ncbi:MAG: WecB/TagA/CpsF family glycosyltransferase [Candidatus Falkowbacteria bacterium]
MKYVHILGISLPVMSSGEIWRQITAWCDSEDHHQIVTLNPEIILAAQQDEELFYIINQSQLVLADGFGLILAASLSGSKIARVTGADLVPQILNYAKVHELKVLILDWNKGLSKSADIYGVIADRFSGLKALVCDIEKDGADLPLNQISEFAPHIALVGLGAPWQEKIIYHQLKHLPSLRLSTGVGGSFDFLTKKITRAPKWMRFIGIEWLWRLLKQPSRLKRIYNATVIFFAMFLFYRFVQPKLYRPNVACWLYKSEQGKDYVLLVQRAQSNTVHWQLPQGGRSFESIKKAGLRELKEELNTDSIVAKKDFKNLHQYRFPNHNPSLERERHGGWRGQKQSLLIAEFTGKDEDVSVNFWDHSGWRWVPVEEIVDQVHEVRKPSAKIFLEKFKEFKKTINR